MSRKGPTRIPTFGSRIPLPGQITNPTSPSNVSTPLNETLQILDTNIIIEESLPKYREPTKSDIGRKVRLGDREGILKYLGIVHFASGVWCGVEVNAGTGKNNGSVRGIQYFSCQKSCGLMAPLSKVFVIEDVLEDASGPYSMLFGFNETKSIIRSRTFDKIEVKDHSSRKHLDNVYNNDANSSFEKGYDLKNTSNSNDCNNYQKGRSNVLKEVVSNISEDVKRNFVLENLIDFNSALNNQHTHSSPRKIHHSPSQLDDDINKRDSLEFEESLGILTPDQMHDVTGLIGSRTPSSENIRMLPHDELSPKVESIKDFSLGLIDEHILSALTMKTDTMNLPLEKHDETKNFLRIEQTPSPEELPLDPTPITDGKEQNEQNKKSTNSFITSITSITSLDTGYQGDGEMSRPGSRGADNSPLTRRPQPRQPARRSDPMTDSDFYTESDADNHEDHPLQGDRKAQVIDGTLYGVDPQAAADIYANNRENMDSSGVFTDIEKTDDLSSAEIDIQNIELSPSDSSTKTISDDSQTNINLIIIKTPPKMETTPSQTPSLNSTVASSPSSIRSPHHTSKNNKEDVSCKKYKMPKRNVASKVKAMIEPANNKENEKRTPPKKIVNRWDAVMNKISKGPPEVKKLKEVKSKVFVNLTTNAQRNMENVKNSNLKSPNNKLKRVRVRVSPNKGNGSINSSLSDLSAASPSKINGSTKKRDVARVTQILATNKLVPKSNSAHNLPNDTKSKTNSGLSNETSRPNINRNVYNSKEKKKEPTKEIGRATVKGGRVSPGTRPPQQPRAALKPPSPRTTEALAILVQHLVFNLEAFKNPVLKKELEKVHIEAEETRLTCKQLEESLVEEQKKHVEIMADVRTNFSTEMAQLVEKHRNEIMQINSLCQERAKNIEVERENLKIVLMKQHEEQIRILKKEFDKLQRNHEESLEILREENDAIREEMDEKNVLIKELERYHSESDKLRKDYEAREIDYKEQLNFALEEISRLRSENGTLFDTSSGSANSYQEVQSLRAVLELKQRDLADIRKILAEATQKADQLPAAEEKLAVLVAKCEDLQHQLERKNEYELKLLSENKKLHDSFIEEVKQKKRLCQHNEELQWKLQQNKEVVTKVLEEAEASALTRSMLSASFNERHSVTNHRPNFERTLSFRERSLSSKSTMSQCSERSRKSKNSFDIDLDDISPPSSPKVKGVVEKSDSVSYVLEMDESPEVVASRIVRRSFRNATPPKNTPTKSPGNKRVHLKNNLHLSASSSAIITSMKMDQSLSQSECMTNSNEGSDDIFIWDTKVSTSTPNTKQFDTYWSTPGDFDEDIVEIKLPSLPSEIGRKNGNTLPVPKHMAGEAMISESNSEDECSTSSSSGQL